MPARFLFAALLILGLCGCPSSDVFNGRLIIVNSTGRAMRSPVLSDSPLDLGRVPIPKLPDLDHGQGTILDCGGSDGTLIWADHLDFTFLDESGEPRIIRIPFKENIPDHSHDDYYIEFGGYDYVRTGILTLRHEPIYAYFVALTHLSAVGIGVFLAWAFRRRRAHPVISHLDPRLM